MSCRQKDYHKEAKKKIAVLLSYLRKEKKVEVNHQRGMLASASSCVWKTRRRMKGKVFTRGAWNRHEKKNYPYIALLSFQGGGEY